MANPTVPSGKVSDQQLAIFVWQQREAANDCRYRLNYVGKLQGSIR